MRTAGIDIGAEQHVVAILDEQGAELLKPTTVTEDLAGYEQLFALLGDPQDLVVALEATGHYWRNLFAALVGRGYRVAVLNPLRTSRFAEEELRRAKTDAIDARGIARFALEKRPAPAAFPDAVRAELRELVVLRSRTVQDLADRVRALHRLVDLVFPEFTRLVKKLESQLATAILLRHPTARAIAGASPRLLAKLKYDSRHQVGEERARQLQEAARRSVGAHQTPVYARGVRYACEDISRLRERLAELDREIEATLDRHDVAPLLRSIKGIGPATSAYFLAVLGDPAEFRSAKAIASYVGLVPATRQSGKRLPGHAPLHPLGHAALRAALWMPTLCAIRHNPWLRAFYRRLVASGKPKKLAIVAAMRKLLEAVHYVARTRQPFIPRIAA